MNNRRKLPFDYFDKLTQDGNNYKCKKNIGFGSFQDEYGNYLPNVVSTDFESGILKYWKLFHDQQTNDSVEGTVTYNFDEEFKNEITKEIENTKEILEGLVFEVNLNGNNSNVFLKTQLKQINYFIETLELTFPKKLGISNSLNALADYFIKKYSLPHVKHSVIESKEFSYYGIKDDVKKSTINYLYDVATQYYIINDEIVSEDSFFNVLTKNPTDTKDYIKFYCNNHLAVQFIIFIQPLFNNFTFSQIDKSKQFYTKTNKLFNQADLNNTKTRLKNNKSFKVEQLRANLLKISKDIF